MQKQQEDFAKMIERFSPPAKEEKELSRTAELERTVKDLSRNIQDRDSRDKAAHLRKLADVSARANGIDPEFSGDSMEMNSPKSVPSALARCPKCHAGIKRMWLGLFPGEPCPSCKTTLVHVDGDPCKPVDIPLMEEGDLCV